ncbi:phosphate transporter [Paraphysoderma sedebokerense]|nr:phosphate transporter [Paraphysoderma sedebokerense]
MQPYDYLWLVIVGFIVAFADAFGIGANDVSNSFATSVASRSLTLKQACFIAVFTEFFGAFLMGRGTSEAVRGIVNANVFANQPELLLLAMVCSLIGSSTWVIFASSKGWPVSTTHSIVGAICGTVLVAFGAPSLKWGYTEKGIAFIASSWLLSPVVSGFVASGIFLFSKKFVLTAENSYQRAKVATPIYFFVAVAINVFYVTFESGLGKGAKPDYGLIALISLGISTAVALWARFFYIPWIARIIENEEDLRFYHVMWIHWVPTRPPKRSASLGLDEDEVDLEKKLAQSSCSFREETPEPKSLFARLKKKLTKGLEAEIVDYKKEEMSDIHNAAVRFDSKTEELYSFLQVLTACAASFAHGSNDVANAVGPLSTIWYIYTNGDWPESANKVPVPLWILAFGGIAIDIGLVTYGYHVMRRLGNHITYQSPSRGFSMELGTSLTVLTASKIGLPVSTTHCLVGATAGVGLCNGSVKAINWKMLGTAFFSWIVTLPMAGSVAGAIFAIIIYSPHKA